ncbi:hypothetical protein ABS768_17525 [Flavobacterium sp. ST-75]|uniref:Lipoprotein n=1 Tax=Flavobacterium rhizophilum TaxID=3163296 RepID=A0ABW8YH36_9FLAO
MYKFLVIPILLFCCTTSKTINNTQIIERQNNNLYYVNCTLFVKNSHTLNMSGLGNSFSKQLLGTKTLNSFKETFYEQLTYTPLLEPTSYFLLLKCLNYDYHEDWNKLYYDNYTLSERLELYKIKLEDGNYLTIEVYKVIGDVKVIYSDDFNCLVSNSVEIDVKKIKTINRIAVLIPKDI